MVFPQAFLENLDTPSLVVDLAAAERNIMRAVDMVRRRAVRLRPHFKAHKMTALLRLQVDAGCCSGVTCATAQEAEILAKAGFDDILVANQIADKAGLAALARAASLKRVTVCVDSIDHVAMLAGLTDEHRVRLGVLIEIDVGLGRCGLDFGSDRLLPLASEIRSAGNLDFLGLQGYEGHAVIREDRGVRKTLVWQAHQVLNHEKQRLRRDGFPCPVISGGGTGTLESAAATGMVTEIQAGSYVLMDALYAEAGVPFENALYCCTTLISRRGADCAVLNAGLKSISGEYGVPKAADGGFAVLGLSDEHARIRPLPSWRTAIGDPVLLIPAHIDPTVNLHDVVFAYGPDGSTRRWAVDGRRVHR